MSLRPFVAALPVLTLLVGGCAHENDLEGSPAQTESAGDFARRAFAEMDAADSCPDLEVAWDEYLAPDTRAAVRRLVPCGREVLAAEHPVTAVRKSDVNRYFNDPVAAALLSADDLDEVELDVPPALQQESFAISELLGTGWVVVTDDAGRSLFNTTLGFLDECLQVQETCQMAG